MTWESPPLHRQLSTIGIGPVFISASANDGSISSCCSNQIIQTTSEIIGAIKTSPEDFIVREISLGGDIAGVTRSSEGVGDTKLSIYNATKVQDNATKDTAAGDKSQQSSKSATNTNAEVTNIDTNPEEGLQRILTQCCTQDMKDNKSDQHVQKLLQQLNDLQKYALDGIIASPTSKMDDDKVVWIPTAALVTKEDRKLLHQYIRQVFCFLRTETSSRDNKDTANNPLQKDTTDAVNNKSWVCCLIDYTFFSIVPCLAHPCEDLQLLYKFRNDGPIPSLLGGDGRGSNHNRGKNRNRKFKERGGGETRQTRGMQPNKGYCNSSFEA